MQTVTLICNSKTLSLSSKDLPVNNVRIDILNETIDEINNIISLSYTRDRLEGNQYTSENFNREI